MAVKHTQAMKVHEKLPNEFSENSIFSAASESLHFTKAP